MTRSHDDLDSVPPFDLTSAVCFASVIAWGVFAGTRLLNLPLAAWWQELPPQQLVAWFEQNQPRFNGLLFPLGAIVGGLSALSLITAWPWRRSSPRRRFWLGVATMCFAVIFSFNPLFYDTANAQLATPGALTDQAVHATLHSWVALQWLRTVISIIGLIAAVAGLASTVSDRRAAYIAELS